MSKELEITHENVYKELFKNQKKFLTIENSIADKNNKLTEDNINRRANIFAVKNTWKEYNKLIKLCN